MATDVVIVGAGLAGLACGQRLAACSISFQILEAADRPGGRLRTDVVAGCRLDNAFPYHFPEAPETRRLLADLPLDWKPFSQSVMVRCDGRFHPVADPRQQPLIAFEEVMHPLGTRRDIARVLQLLQKLEESADPAAHDERLALDWLRWNGKLSPAII
ncbi:MAG TPA: NAD(P)-binding protein, partial [Urbifossiella sp.]|nr:NAD(P)-binding protein [Urbifossiella sp.]